MTDLTPMPKVRVDLVDELLDSPTDVLVQMNRRDSTVFDVYRVNVVTGDTTMIARNPGNITGWLADHHGRIRGALTTDGVNGTVLFRPTEADTFRVIARTTFKDTFNPLFFTFDDQALYASSNLGRDKTAIVLFDPATGREREVLFEHPEVDVDGLELFAEASRPDDDQLRGLEAAAKVRRSGDAGAVHLTASDVCRGRRSS